MKNCVTCEFCQPMDNERGICRFEPPHVMGKPVKDRLGNEQIVQIALWPIVALTKDWCGKYNEQMVKPVQSLSILGKN